MTMWVTVRIFYYLRSMMDQASELAGRGSAKNRLSHRGVTTPGVINCGIGCMPAHFAGTKSQSRVVIKIISAICVECPTDGSERKIDSKQIRLIGRLRKRSFRKQFTSKCAKCSLAPAQSRSNVYAWDLWRVFVWSLNLSLPVLGCTAVVCRFKVVSPGFSVESGGVIN